MKNLSKEKRNQLVLVIMIFAGVLAGWYLVLYKNQTESLAGARTKCAAAQQKLHEIKLAIDSAEETAAELVEGKKALEKIEGTMATGDLYSWAINMVRQFKMGYKVEIPQFSQIDGPKTMNMLPDFPYQQALLTIGGSGQFHDFGKFVADFENQYPYIRVLNLSLEPVSGLVPGDREKLAFRMEIATLVKPGA